MHYLDLKIKGSAGDVWQIVMATARCIMLIYYLWSLRKNDGIAIVMGKIEIPMFKFNVFLRRAECNNEKHTIQIFLDLRIASAVQTLFPPSSACLKTNDDGLNPDKCSPWHRCRCL